MPWYVAAFELLVQVSLAGCVLLGLAGIAVWLLREPARRIRVIELTLAGLLALPAVVLIPGYPRVAVLPARSVETDRMPVQPPAPPGGYSDAAQSNSAQPPALPGGSVERAARNNDPPTVATKNPPAKPGADQRERNVPQPDANEAESPAASVPPVRNAKHPAHPNAARALPALLLPTDYRLWIVLAYCCGACAMLGWSLVGWLALRRLVRGSRPAEPSVRNLLRELAGPAGDRVRLLVSARAAQPCAFGWWRPTIVLPENLVAGGDARQLRFALAHEWSHVVRGDLAAWTLAGVARAVHFQQPLVWLLRRQLRLSQDYLADAAAAGTATPEDYAEFLTQVSQAFKRPKLAPGLGIAARRSDLHRRVVMLVENARPLERVTPRRWNLLVLFVAISAVATVASLRAEPKPPEPKTNLQVVPPAANPYGIQRQVIIGPDGKVIYTDPDNKPAEPVDDARTLRRAPQPFSGKIRPGDIMNIEIVGGIPGVSVPPRTVEPDGNVALSSAYGSKRIHVAGKSLTEAGTAIEEYLRTILRQPIVLVTYDGHDDGVVAEVQVGHTAPGTLISKAGPTTVAAAPSHRPFSGKIRPGDILMIEMVGGLPDSEPWRRIVEPDGNLPLGAAFGVKSRAQVGGKTLIEAGKHIENELRAMLKDPKVLLTYEGHDDGVVAVDEAGAAAPPIAPAPKEAVVLKPLDTIEVIVPINSNHRFMIDGTLVDGIDGVFPLVSGTYVIEPDGNVALPKGLGRIMVANKSEAAAGAAIRSHLTDIAATRIALPSAHVMRRGRAVFPDGKQPAADYRIQPGDKLLTSMSGSMRTVTDTTVDEHGKVSRNFPPDVSATGLTLSELEQELRTNWKPVFFGGPGTGNGPPPVGTFPWYVTIGGWREEADPAVIDRIEQADSTRVERLEQELQEIKTMIRGLKPR